MKGTENVGQIPDIAVCVVQHVKCNHRGKKMPGNSAEYLMQKEGYKTIPAYNNDLEIEI